MHNNSNEQIASLLPVYLAEAHDHNDDIDNDDDDDILDNNHRTPVVPTTRQSSSRCCNYDVNCCSRRVKVKATARVTTTTSWFNQSSSSSSRLSCADSWPVVIIALFVEGCAVLGISLLTHAVFHNPLCGLVFRCGCTFNPWLGGTGWLLCNVHHPNNTADTNSPAIPRCPWCKSSRDTPTWTWTTGRTIIIVGMMLAWATTTIVRMQYLCAAAEVVTTTTTSRRRNNSWMRLLCYSKWPRLFRMVLVPLLYFIWYHVVTGLIWCVATGYPYWLCFTFPNRQPASVPLEPIHPS